MQNNRTVYSNWIKKGTADKLYDRNRNSSVQNVQIERFNTRTATVSNNSFENEVKRLRREFAVENQINWESHGHWNQLEVNGIPCLSFLESLGLCHVKSDDSGNETSGTQTEDITNIKSEMELESCNPCDFELEIANSLEEFSSLSEDEIEPLDLSVKKQVEEEPMPMNEFVTSQYYEDHSGILRCNPDRVESVCNDGKAKMEEKSALLAKMTEDLSAGYLDSYKDEDDSIKGNRYFNLEGESIVHGCFICGQEFAKRIELETHMNQHVEAIDMDLPTSSSANDSSYLYSNFESCFPTTDCHHCSSCAITFSLKHELMEHEEKYHPDQFKLKYQNATISDTVLSGTRVTRTDFKHGDQFVKDDTSYQTFNPPITTLNHSGPEHAGLTNSEKNKSCAVNESVQDVILVCPTAENQNLSTCLKKNTNTREKGVCPGVDGKPTNLNLYKNFFKETHVANDKSQHSDYLRKDDLMNPSCNDDAKFCTDNLIKQSETKHQCKICLKEFTNLTSFEYHMASHTVNNKKLCYICGKLYASKVTLHLHIRTHKGIKPHKCSICHKSFSQSHSLKAHLTMHSGAKPYKCLICRKEYRHSASLKNHLKKHPDLSAPPKPVIVSTCPVNQEMKEQNIVDNVKRNE